MSAEADKAMAKALADRSKEQAKNASKNAGRAAKAAAKAATEEVGDVVEEANDTAEDAVDAIGDKVIKPTIRFIPTPVGKATLGYVVGIVAIAYATRQSKIAYLARVDVKE